MLRLAGWRGAALEVAGGLVAGAAFCHGAAWVWDAHFSWPRFDVKPKTREEKNAVAMYPVEPWPHPGDQEAVARHLDERQLIKRSQDATKTVKQIQTKDDLRAHAIWRRMRQDLAEEVVSQGFANDANMLLNDTTIVR